MVNSSRAKVFRLQRALLYNNAVEFESNTLTALVALAREQIVCEQITENSDLARHLSVAWINRYRKRVCAKFVF